MTDLIDIKGVTHAYQTPNGPLPVLDNLNVSVPEGEFAAVVGPSGCGKSTLTRLVAGLMKPDQGEVWLHGKLVKSPRKTVGMAFQNPVMLEWRTILQNVMLPLEIVAPGMPKKQRVERAMELLDLVGLTGFENKRPSELSGSMRQRASLCRAIVHKPDVLIMDEPFGALDAQTRLVMHELLLNIWRKHRATVLFVTHDVDEALLLSDHVQVMSQAPGRLIRHYHLTQQRPRAFSRSGSDLLEIRDEILDLLHPKTDLADSL